MAIRFDLAPYETHLCITLDGAWPDASESQHARLRVRQINLWLPDRPVIFDLRTTTLSTMPPFGELRRRAQAWQHICRSSPRMALLLPRVGRGFRDVLLALADAEALAVLYSDAEMWLWLQVRE